MFKLSFKRQVLTGFAVSLVFVLISAITSYLSIEKLNENTTWQGHTYDVISVTKDINTYVLNSETSVRGFILSEDPKYLESYENSSPKILPAIQELRRLVNDNPKQLERIDSLEYYGVTKVDEMRQVLKLYEKNGKADAAKRVMEGRGRYYKYKMLAISQKIMELENELLKLRKKAIRDSSTQSEWVVSLSAGIIFCLILFLFSYIKKTFDQQKKTEAHILDSNLKLETISVENEQRNWLLSGATTINEGMRGEQEVEELANNIIARLCNYVQVQVGTIYLSDPDTKTFKFTGGYAFQSPKGAADTYGLGEGLIGQAAAEKQAKLLTDIPENYLKISSGLGEMKPTAIYVLPVLFENQTLAVIELAFDKSPPELALQLLNTVAESIGVGLNSAVARRTLRDLYDQTQQQAEELESQQEELRTTNEELTYKTEQLQASEEELRVQQEELRQTNAELEEKAKQLEERNILVTQAREAMTLKAEELEMSSKYKSEFLANMSHELRTPLNSILILARILKENRNENLNEDQIKYAGVIHTAGSDLLSLINDILDLSKIESGKIDLTIEPLTPVTIRNDMEALFGELARSKNIKFNTTLDDDLPEFLLTDQARLEQIIKNLLSNAFKFTPELGQITLTINPSKRGAIYYSDQLKDYSGQIIAISVEDSGIGIPEDKQKLIFEAFQQADGSTSRKYGGTGLGLSISKELAHILGGEIQVKSEPNVGSTFTLFVPERHDLSVDENAVQVQLAESKVEAPAEDYTHMKTPGFKGMQTLLIVEDDVVFADVLRDYATERGFNAILAHRGDTGLEMATSQLPDAIVLDIMLPVMDGWEVLRKLKADPRTMHIPVHIMSAGNEKESKAKQAGAIGFLKKPIEKDQLDDAFNLLSSAHAKYDFDTVLVVEDQELHSTVLTNQLKEKGINVRQAFTGKEALDLLRTHTFDCIILDLKLPDISGFELLDMIKSQPALVHVPVIINTAMELDEGKMSHIMRYSEAMVLKSNKSNDRLIDEVSLFMNKLKQGQSPIHVTSSKKGKGVSTIERVLKDKTILITDDDMRNIFALSSALEQYEMNIIIANNGKEAIQRLGENVLVDLVLMDIMMPEMDGYQAMKEIRQDKRFTKLPIIALTAKAMKNDRERCIEAGASDYISKPVDMDKLLSMMRVWLS